MTSNWSEQGPELTADGPRLSEKIALVTGASRGIGAATARRLAAEGAQVIAVARTVGGLEELDDAIQADAKRLGTGGAATLVPLNLREFNKIDEMAMNVAQRWGRLDILVGNAGVLGQLGPAGHVPPKVWDEVMDVNLNANYRLIRAFDEGLRRSTAGRAVFLTSGAASEEFAYWSNYAASKAGLEQLVKCYAAEMKKSTVRANLFDPGAIATGLRATAFPGEKPETLPGPETAADALVSLLLPTHGGNGVVVRGY